jgi:hypothetical protein
MVAGLEPAQRNGELATLAGGLAHDVSILLGIGRHFGSQPGAKVSIKISGHHSIGKGKAARVACRQRYPEALAGWWQAGRR